MKVFPKFRILALLMALILLLPLCASAKSRGREELVTINLDHAHGLDFEDSAYFQARWIQVIATIDGTQDVTLQVIHDDDHKPDAKDKVVYSKTTKNVQGSYVSPEIFLKFVSSNIEAYRIELSAGGQVLKTATVHRMLLNLNGNTVCLRGLRFHDISATKTDKWFTFYPINLTHAQDGTALELVGSNMYLVGNLVIHRDGSKVMFTLLDYDQLGYNSGQAMGEGYASEEHLHSYEINNHEFQFSDVRIGVYHKFSDVENVARSAISRHIVPGRWYELRQIGADHGPVILYLNGRINYNPNGLPRVNATVNKDHLAKLMDTFAY